MQAAGARAKSKTSGANVRARGKIVWHPVGEIKRNPKTIYELHFFVLFVFFLFSSFMVKGDAPTPLPSTTVNQSERGVPIRHSMRRFRGRLDFCLNGIARKRSGSANLEGVSLGPHAEQPLCTLDYSELDVEVKGALAMPPLESGGAASSALLNPGSTPFTPVKSRRWRDTVAWTVALWVLLFVLVWVGGGGLDIPPSSTSAVGTSGAPDGGGGFSDGGGVPDEGEAAEEEQRNPEPADSRTENLSKAKVPEKEYRGEVTGQMRKTARAKGLIKEEIAGIERAANAVVNEALRGPGDFPVPSPQKYYSEACNVMVDGLPLIGSKQQRCCNVADIQRLKRPDGGAVEVLSGVGLPPKRPQGNRVLEAGLGEGGGGEGGDGGLPAAVKTESTGGVKDEGLACFPSFVIAGTQKSGTTALAGILEKHPQVKMAPRKELHFFDTKPPNTKSSEFYASSFARLNGSETMENQELFVTGEATPFYLASRNACMHIRKLLPGARLIVLVREPVKRSYSEHQMQVRRVEELQEMLKLLPLNANVVYDCVTQILHSDVHNITKREDELLRDPQLLSAAIGECAGEIGQHGKWADVMFPFVRRLRTQMRALLTDTARVIEGVREDFNRCFPLKSIAQEMERLHPGGAWKAHWTRNSLGPVARSIDGRGAPNPRPHTPRGNLAHVPEARDRQRRNRQQKNRQHRNGQHRNLQHDQYYQNGEGTGGGGKPSMAPPPTGPMPTPTRTKPIPGCRWPLPTNTQPGLVRGGKIAFQELETPHMAVLSRGGRAADRIMVRKTTSSWEAKVGRVGREMVLTGRGGVAGM